MKGPERVSDLPGKVTQPKTRCRTGLVPLTLSPGLLVIKSVSTGPSQPPRLVCIPTNAPLGESQTRNFHCGEVEMTGAGSLHGEPRSPPGRLQGCAAWALCRAVRKGVTKLSPGDTTLRPATPETPSAASPGPRKCRALVLL